MRSVVRGNVWAGAVAAVVVAGFSGCPWYFPGFTEFRSLPVTESFALDAGGQLNITNEVGPIEIVGADTNTVTITYVKKAQVPNRATGALEPAAFYLDQIGVSLSGSGAAVTVDGTAPGSTAGFSGSVAFTIQAPRSAVTDLQCNVGSAEITGMRGAMDVAIDVGSAEIQRDTAPQPDEGITCGVNVGDIDLALPGDSIFSLDALTNVGDIDLGAIFGIGVSRSNVVGATATGSTGANGAAISLQVDVGSIQVRAG